MSFADQLKLTVSELAWGFGSWRSQVFALAKNEMGKSTKKSALGWFWIFFQPAVYIACFWFALYMGIKAVKGDMNGTEYLLWIASGVIPWWFMRTSLNSSPGALTRYGFLVNKLKFPVALIPAFTELAYFLIHLILLVPLFIGYFACGGQITIYFLQLPLLMLLMLLFFTGYSMLVSVLCAYSADLAQLLRALTTPIFWLSGILFDVTTLSSHAVQTALMFDPVSTLVLGYRKVFSLSNPGWVWDDPVMFGIFIVILVVTFVAGLLMFAKLRKDLPDVL